MYPVGVLFGLGEPSCFPACSEFGAKFKSMISGFDTASSIALLAVTALAKKGSHGTLIQNSQIIILPVSDSSFRSV
jgi:high-affinity nickel permease